MAKHSFPALGFDPAPGEAQVVQEVAGRLIGCASGLDEDAGLLDSIKRAPIWEGDAAEAFAGETQTLIGDLRRAARAVQGFRGANPVHTSTDIQGCPCSQHAPASLWLVCPRAQRIRDTIHGVMPVADESVYPSEHAAAVLHAAGWSPDKLMDISGWIDELTQDGHHVFPVAELILELYGGLRLNHKLMGGQSCHDLRIDPAYGGERDRLELIEWILGKRVCPVGVTFGAAMLAVVEDGKVITDFDGDVVQIGDSWRAALDRIVLGHGQDYVQLAEDYEPIRPGWQAHHE